MTDQRKPFPAVEPPSDQPFADDDVMEPPPEGRPGARGVDDHVAGRPLGLGHQPSDDLEDEADDEDLASPTHGARPEPRP